MRQALPRPWATGTAGPPKGPGGRVLATSPQRRAQLHGDAEMEARSEERELERAPRSGSDSPPDEQPPPSRSYQLLTVAGILILAASTLFFELDIGFVAITIGLVLTLIAPQQKGAVGQVPWPEILLIIGVGTYVGLLEEMGTIDYVGESVADLASPLLVALLLCFIAATAVSSTIVDVSPFSTNSALVLANAPESVDRNRFLRQPVAYGALVTVLAPVVLWLVFVVVLG